MMIVLVLDCKISKDKTAFYSYSHFPEPKIVVDMWQAVCIGWLNDNWLLPLTLYGIKTSNEILDIVDNGNRALSINGGGG